LYLASIQSNYILMAFLCMGAALLFFVCELFIPSNGVLGLLSAIAAIAGIVLFFRSDPQFGLIATAVVLLFIPIGIVIALSVWPHTAVGRALTRGESQEASSEAYGGKAEVMGVKRSELIGRTGKAVTSLRPVGTVLIDGKRHECLSVYGAIDRDTQVKVVSVRGNEIKVQPIEEA
jgi:membrane-bound serine protease (ClpP class)